MPHNIFVNVNSSTNKTNMAVPRESQIDAVELDSECYNLFQSQLNQSLAHLPINFLKRIEPEILAFLNLAVYVIPVYTSSSLISHELLGIKFLDGNTNKVPKKWYAYGLLIVGMKWVSQRWSSITSSIFSENTNQPVSQLLNGLHTSSKVLSLLNSLVFLKQGHYPTLLHRFLNLKTQLIDPNQPKSADLSTLTRELLWHSFAEMLMFVLPLVNVHRLKSWFFRLSKLNQGPTTITGVRNKMCAICNETPIIPQETQCNHVFCYYCLKANLEAVVDFCCPLCTCPILKD